MTEQELVEEAYRALLPVLLGRNPDTGELEREWPFFEFHPDKADRLDLHSVMVAAIVAAMRTWVERGYVGNHVGYAHEAALFQMRKAAGHRKERDKHEQSFDVPLMDRRLVRGVTDGAGGQVFEYLPSSAPPPSTPPEVEQEPESDEAAKALAALILAALEDGALKEHDAEALYRMTDLHGDGGAATTYTELGEMLGIGRSGAYKRYTHAVERLRRYAEENNLTMEETHG